MQLYKCKKKFGIKVGIKIQSFSCVLSQRLVSVLFIAAVPTHMENSYFFLVLVCVLFCKFLLNDRI